VDYQSVNELFSTDMSARTTEVFAESLAGLMELREPQTTQKAAGKPGEQHTFLTQLSRER